MSLVKAIKKIKICFLMFTFILCSYVVVPVIIAEDNPVITDNTVIFGVPFELDATDQHLCIPTAIAQLGAYYGRNGYSGFGCTYATDVETKAIHIQQYMDSLGTDGSTSNSSIPIAFENSFYHINKVNGNIYALQATNEWNITWDDIVSEIDSGYPCLLGFSSTGPYGGGHMTICNGYCYSDGDEYVYLSDGWDTQKYAMQPFDTSYNDFISSVRIIIHCTLENTYHAYTQESHYQNCSCGQHKYYSPHIYKAGICSKCGQRIRGPFPQGIEEQIK